MLRDSDNGSGSDLDDSSGWSSNSSNDSDDHGFSSDDGNSDVEDDDNTQEPDSVLSFVWSDGEGFIPDVHPFQCDRPGVTGEFPCDDQARESDYFRAYMDDEVMSFIAEQTNAQHRRRSASEGVDEDTPRSRTPKWQDTTPRELYEFFALILLMPLNKKAASQLYWSRNPVYRSDIFATYMSRNRFSSLLKYLHFADNENPNLDDRIWKVREVFTMLLSRYKKYFYPFQKLIIDESIMPFKGRIYLKQFNPHKRHRFGIKLFILCDCETGMVLDVIVYTGSDVDIPRVNRKDPIGYSGSCVKTLMATYLGKGHILYTDNWYTSPALSHFLHDNNTGSCGTVKANRKFMPKFDGQKKILDNPSVSDTQDGDAAHDQNKCGNRNKDRYIQTKRSGKFLAVKFHDKRDVHFFSTVHTGEVVRTGKQHYTTKKHITKPDVVVDYNENMRLVDKCDSMLSHTECIRPTVRWYIKLFFRFVDITMLNAFNMWLVTHESGPTHKLSLRKFHERVAVQLLQDFGVPRATVNGGHHFPQIDRLAGLASVHRPVYTETVNGQKRQLNCYVCSHTTRRPKQRKRTQIKCSACDVALCIVSCFGDYHALKNF